MSKELIKDSIKRIEQEKNKLVDLLYSEGIDSEDEPCEALETLISAVEELNQITFK